MRKERGYVGIVNTLLPLYSSGGSDLGHLVLAGWRGLAKAGLVQSLHWAVATLGGAPGGLAPPAASIWLPAPGPSTEGRAGTRGKKGGEALTFFPSQDDGGFNKKHDWRGVKTGN